MILDKVFASFGKSSKSTSLGFINTLERRKRRKQIISGLKFYFGKSTTKNHVHRTLYRLLNLKHTLTPSFRQTPLYVDPYKIQYEIGPTPLLKDRQTYHNSEVKKTQR